jgi:hypothetical protein
MNTEHTYATLRDDVKLINVHFNEPAVYLHDSGEDQKAFIRTSHTNPGTYRKYSYKATVAMGLRPGDAAVVPVNDGEMKLVMVAEVLDINAAPENANLKWVISGVNLEPLIRIMQQESEFCLAVKTSRNAQIRREALTQLTSEQGLDVGMLQGLDGMSHLGKLLSADNAVV